MSAPHLHDPEIYMHSSYSNSSPIRAKVPKKRSRKVTFASQSWNSVVHVECSKEHRSNAWYSKGYLDRMRAAVKLQAKDYMVALEKTTLISSCDSTNMSSLVMPFENSGVEKKMRVLRDLDLLSGVNTSWRGLEPRIFIERQRNRIIALKTVLEYQRRTQALIKVAQSQGHTEGQIKAMREGFADRLGDISSHLSAWSRDEAISSAQYDAARVYGRFGIYCKMTEGQLLREMLMTTSSQKRLSVPKLTERPLNTIDNTTSFQSTNKRNRCIFNEQDQIHGSSKRCRIRTVR